MSCLRACFGARLLPQSYQYPNLSEGADCVAGQLRGDEECPFSGVTKSGRVWRKVPESDARSVGHTYTLFARQGVWFAALRVHFICTTGRASCGRYGRGVADQR